MSRSVVASVALVVAATTTTLTPVVEGNFLLKNVLPQTYLEGQQMVIKTNSLTSHEKVMPMPWQSMPWCHVDATLLKKYKAKQSLGEILFGKKVEPSMYAIAMKQDEKCVQLCKPIEMDEKQQKLLTSRIEDAYRGHLLLDNLPVAEEGTGVLESTPVISGFPLGLSKKSVEKIYGKGKQADLKTKVYNHLEFTVHIHEPTAFLFNEDFDMEMATKKEKQLYQQWADGKLNQSSYRVVGFDVSPFSIDYTAGGASGDDVCKTFNLAEATKSPVYSDAKKITWTYGVKFEMSDVEWSTRWDHYTRSTKKEASIHWMSIINSFLMVILLSAVIAIILVHAVCKDLSAFIAQEGSDLPLDERDSGWKQLNGDVFRRPEEPEQLAICVGSGSQMLACSITTIALGLFGIASPQRRGSVATIGVFLYVCMGMVCGYVSARFAKLFQVRSWKLIFLSGAFLPVTLFILFFALNFVHWGSKASSAAPITAMLTVAMLFLCVSLPLVFLGAAVGFRQDNIKMPSETKITQKPIPELPVYLDSWWATCIPSLLPFGASFIEASFLLSSVWQGRVYHMFGFLAIVWTMVLITTAEAAMVMVYLRLCKGCYKWWWTSYTCAACYGVWLYLYGLFYYCTVLQISSFWSSILYFGYMAMLAHAMALMTGSVGFLASFFFVRKIFGSIKAD